MVRQIIINGIKKLDNKLWNLISKCNNYNNRKMIFICVTKPHALKYYCVYFPSTSTSSHKKILFPLELN